MIHALIFMAALLSSGRERLPTTQVDLIEFNTHYNSANSKDVAYSQLIFWEWSHDYQRFDVVDWSMVETGVVNMPAKVGEDWQCVVRKQGKDLRVVGRQFRRTHTIRPNDPEVVNKRFLRCCDRRGLIRR